MRKALLFACSALCALALVVEPAYAQRGGGGKGGGGDGGRDRGGARQGGGGGQRSVGGGGGNRQGSGGNRGPSVGGQVRAPRVTAPQVTTPQPRATAPQVTTPRPRATAPQVTTPRPAPAVNRGDGQRQQVRVPTSTDVQRDVQRNLRDVQRDINRAVRPDGDRQRSNQYWSNNRNDWDRNRDWDRDRNDRDRDWDRDRNDWNRNRDWDRNQWSRRDIPWYSNYWNRNYGYYAPYGRNYGGRYGNGFAGPYYGNYYGNYYRNGIYGYGLGNLIGWATGIGGFGGVGVPGIGLGYGGYGYGYGPYGYGYSRSYSTPYYVDNSSTTQVESYVAAPAPSGDFLANGRASFLAGEYAEAQRQANHAVIDSPDDPKAHELMMLSMFAQGEFQGAAAAAHAVADLGQIPDWPTLYGYYKDRDKYVQHLTKLQQFVKENPDVPEARFLLGVHYQMIGDNEPAQKQFAEYLKQVQGEDTIAAKLFSSVGGDLSTVPQPSPEVPVNRTETPPVPAQENRVE